MPTTLPLSDTELNALRQRCHTVLAGHKQTSPAEDFAAMAVWCEQHQTEHDVYGDGPLVQEFEQKIARLLGFESAVFCITGTMTQTLALRLACMERDSNLVALHPSAHILKHENSNYQLLDQFKMQSIGDPMRTWHASDLTAIKDKLAAALLELPMREIGGQLPDWEQLEEIKTLCREKNIHLHLDGARLWEAQAGYNRPFPDICRGFDSAYVSFYKGIGALGGAMLLGSSAFTARAKVWMHRQGGSVFRRSPYVVAAAMQFDQRLANMPACYTKTRQLAELLKQFPAMQLNPSQPQCNMFHLYLPVSRERATIIRNQIAQQHGIWLFGRAIHAALPGQCYFEWTVGDALLALTEAQIVSALTLLQQAIKE